MEGVSGESRARMPKREGGLRLRGIAKATAPGRPLVTVVTIVRNGKAHIEETIRSVVDQSYDAVEYLVIDGGSTDGTPDIIARYEDRIDYWISEPDEGISDAMNKGILLAHGELIVHLHADDYLATSSVVSSVCSEYLRRPGALWMTGGINIVDGDGRILEEIKVRRYSYKRLLRGNILLHPATFVTRKAFERVGMFDTGYRFAMDYDLWLRLGGIEDPVTLDLQVACFRAHADSRSISRSDLAYGESWEIRKKFLRGHPLRTFCHYLYYRICRRFVRAYYRNLLAGRSSSR